MLTINDKSMELVIDKVEEASALELKRTSPRPGVYVYKWVSKKWS